MIKTLTYDTTIPGEADLFTLANEVDQIMLYVRGIIPALREHTANPESLNNVINNYEYLFERFIAIYEDTYISDDTTKETN